MLERGAERRTEARVDDWIGERRHPSQPDGDSPDTGGHGLDAAGTGRRQEVEHEERCPEQDEHDEDDAEHASRFALESPSLRRYGLLSIFDRGWSTFIVTRNHLVGRTCSLGRVHTNASRYRDSPVIVLLISVTATRLAIRPSPLAAASISAVVVTPSRWSSRCCTVTISRTVLLRH